MQNNQEWLKERKTYLGGSDIAAICGVPSFKKTALDVYFSKVNPEIIELTKAAIARRYAEEHNVEVTIEPKLIRHPKYPCVAGNIDRWVGDREYILECKTAHFSKSKEWGEVGTNQIPESYLCQVAWYAAVCDVPKVDIAVLIGGNDYREYTYIRDKVLEEKLIKIAVNFWQNHVEKRIPPKCSNLNDVSNLFPIGNHKEIKASENISLKIEELKILKEKESALEKSIDTLKVEIQEFMQDNEVLSDSNDKIIATWKNSKSRITFDTKRFEKEHQDIYRQYVKETEGSRMFLIK